MNNVVEPHCERISKTQMGLYLTDIETSFIKKSVDFNQIRIIADLGCGGGKYTLLALQNNANVISLDKDLNSLKWLKQRTNLSNVILGDVIALPLRKNLVDGIFLIEIFDQIRETETLLKECRRILKKDGKFILTFRNSSSFKSKLKQLRKTRYYQDTHSYREIMLFLKDLEFEIIRKEGYNWILLNRDSNYPIIPLLGKIIKTFRLHKLPSISPWVIVYVSKS